jgi:hypothetical protein
MNPLHSLSQYEEFVYTLLQNYSTVRRSTLVLIRRGQTVAVLRGEVELSAGLRLLVREKVTFDTGVGLIEDYSYEVRRGEEQLYWYDSQPHPHVPSLASTHPHHKHIPPDIKHNRIPAPGLSFAQPNLPFLIVEIERVFLTKKP